MTSPTILIQRAAELVIEFGLEYSDATARTVREDAKHDSILLVRWRPPVDFGRRMIELTVLRQTASLSVRTTVDAEGLYPRDAKRVSELYGRVVELAERIEALR